MRHAAIIILSLLWLAWMGQYVLPSAGQGAVPLRPRGRYRYTVAHGRNALPIVLGLNAQIAAGEVPEGVRVYGFWMEQHRLYCDFELIGNIFGYADHTGFVAGMRRGAGGMVDYLVAQDCEYLLFDQRRFRYAQNYHEFKWPRQDKRWRWHFRKVAIDGSVELWQVRDPMLRVIPEREEKPAPPDAV